MLKSLGHQLILIVIASTNAFMPTCQPNTPRIPRTRASITNGDAAIENDAPLEKDNKPCRVLLLDHLNINHQKGCHDALNAFYFDFLKCSIDPRKHENYLAGEKTVWANLGMHQFHLPEGKPGAQVLDGVITLVHENLEGLIERYNDFLDGDDTLSPLRGTQFHMEMEQDDEDSSDDVLLVVTDPWGNQFCILPSDDPEDDRAIFLGAQPSLEGAAPSEGLKLEDLTMYVSHGSNLKGIARFYEQVFCAPTIEELETDTSVSIAMGDRQTLTFQYHPGGPGVEVQHDDLRFDVMDEEGNPSNVGPHISIYVTNLPHSYRMAKDLDVLYVNPRFKRRAYTEDEAIDQCMFRILDIVDPMDKKRNVIVSLEHEVRAVKTRYGKKYKSCPLLEIDF